MLEDDFIIGGDKPDMNLAVTKAEGVDLLTASDANHGIALVDDFEHQAARHHLISPLMVFFIAYCHRSAVALLRFSFRARGIRYCKEFISTNK